MLESERLARAFFERAAEGDHRTLIAWTHPEALIVPVYDATTVVSAAERRDALLDAKRPHVHDAHANVFQAIDDERVVASGRVRYTRTDGVMIEKAAVWALVFHDGLLYRSFPVRDLEDGRRRLAELVRGAEARRT